MNILSAIYSGQTGFLKATESMAARAARVSSPLTEASSDDQLASDVVGMKLDATAAKASLGTAKVADSLLSEFVRDSLKK